MPQLRVGHWVYRIEGQYPETPFFCDKMGVRCLLHNSRLKWSGAEDFLKSITGSYPNTAFFQIFQI
jgi:hypothetical protein